MKNLLLILTAGLLTSCSENISHMNPRDPFAESFAADFCPSGQPKSSLVARMLQLAQTTDCYEAALVLAKLHSWDLSGIGKIEDGGLWPLHRFTNIEEISLAGNGIQRFNEICLLSSPRVVDLSFNRITEIDGSCETFDSVEQLNLSANQIQKISRFSPPNLKSVSLWGNPIEEMGNDVFAGAQIIGLDKLNTNPGQTDVFTSTPPDFARVEIDPRAPLRILSNRNDVFRGGELLLSVVGGTGPTRLHKVIGDGVWDEGRAIYLTSPNDDKVAFRATDSVGAHVELEVQVLDGRVGDAALPFGQDGNIQVPLPSAYGGNAFLLETNSRLFWTFRANDDALPDDAAHIGSGNTTLGSLPGGERLTTLFAKLTGVDGFRRVDVTEVSKCGLDICFVGLASRTNAGTLLKHPFVLKLKNDGNLQKRFGSGGLLLLNEFPNTSYGEQYGVVSVVNADGSITLLVQKADRFVFLCFDMEAKEVFRKSYQLSDFSNGDPDDFERHDRAFSFSLSFSIVDRGFYLLRRGSIKHGEERRPIALLSKISFDEGRDPNFGGAGSFKLEFDEYTWAMLTPTNSGDALKILYSTYTNQAPAFRETLTIERRVLDPQGKELSRNSFDVKSLPSEYKARQIYGSYVACTLRPKDNYEPITHLARLNDDLTLDLTFGENGFLKVPFPEQPRAFHFFPTDDSKSLLILDEPQSARYDDRGIRVRKVRVSK